MPYATTALSPAEQAKIPTPGYTPLLWDELITAMSLPRGQRPRTYGYIEPGGDGSDGQIVTIRSGYDVLRYENRLSFAWMSDTTIADLISRR